MGPHNYRQLTMQLWTGKPVLNRPDGTQDTKVLDVLYNNRDKLRHRFVMEITIELSDGNSYTYHCPTLLPEDVQDLRDSVVPGIGQVIDSTILRATEDAIRNRTNGNGGQMTMPGKDEGSIHLYPYTVEMGIYIRAKRATMEWA